MLLSQFEKTYNESNGWFGLEEMPNSKLKMRRKRKIPLGTPGKRGCSYYDIQYFKLFTCPRCNEGALTTIHGESSPLPDSCGVGGCYKPPVRKRTSSINNMYIHPSGYWCYRIRKLDKNGNYIKVNCGYREQVIWFHRLVVEGYLGRKLLDTEKVHHINMNKLDNDINNLWVANHADHMSAHQSYNKICEELMINYDKYSGIEFNKDTGIYYLIKKENDNE